MKPLIIANWKCNPTTLVEAKRLFNSMRMGIKGVKNVEVIICPPFVFLPVLVASASARGYGELAFGSQNCFWEKKGAFTGEVSASMLKNLGCRYVILGHSERRRYFAETDKIINKKIKIALSEKLKPIFCIGETKEQKEKGETQNVLKSQIEEGLCKISRKEIRNVVIAYEPAWAIGTGNPCDIDEAQKMGLIARKILAQLYGHSISTNFRILYGGSVDSKNAALYVKEAGFSGLLVGGASLEAKEFVKIVKNIIS